MNYFKKMVEHFITINDEEWLQAKGIFEKKSIKKGTIIHQAGDVFSTIWFVRNGLSRSYFIDLNGKEYTWQLYFRGKSKHGLNHFMDDSVSFYEKTGSLLSFEILEDSTFYVASLEDLDEFISKDKIWEYLTRLWLHDTYYAATYKRVISLMSESVAQRYERLFEEYPSIFERVKAYHIASYLGIAPQTLSKLKK